MVVHVVATVAAAAAATPAASPSTNHSSSKNPTRGSSESQPSARIRDKDMERDSVVYNRSAVCVNPQKQRTLQSLSKSEIVSILLMFGN